jgi:dCTP deaminase
MRNLFINFRNKLIRDIVMELFIKSLEKPELGVLCDREIAELCTGDKPMISPFISESVKTVSKCIDLSQERRSYKILSKGLSSAGYDISASAEDVKIFKHIPGEVVDPKNFNPDFLEDAKIYRDNTGCYFIIPGNSYALLYSVEEFNIPSNIKGRCDGKSTNARCAIHMNITPLEPGWHGYLTIEISNGSPSDVKVYLEEGIAQLEFSRINEPNVSYADRNGKYNNQENKVVFAKV